MRLKYHFVTYVFEDSFKCKSIPRDWVPMVLNPHGIKPTFLIRGRRGRVLFLLLDKEKKFKTKN